jgi:hypothetical protein
VGLITDLARKIIGGGTEQPTQQFDGLPYFRNKEEVIAFVTDELNRRQKERRPKELQWILNQNFLNGNQYCDINVFMNEVMQIDKLYDWQEREVFNQIAPIYETRLAKLKKNRPIPFTVPATQESADINTAKTTTAVLKGIDRSQNMSDQRAIATAWAELCGCSFYDHKWDPKGGRLVGDLLGEKVYEGCETKTAFSAFEFFPDSNFANGIEGCRSIIRAKAYTADEIFDIWGVQVQGRAIDVFTLNQTNVGCGGLGYVASVYNFVNTKVENSEIVIQYMEKPNRKHPEGLVIIVAGNQLLHYGPFVYRVGEDGKPGYPISMQICIENPGYFWPSTVLERLIPIQRSYNAVKNRKHEVLNRIAIGVLAVQDNGNQDMKDLEDEGLYPGKILTFGPGEEAPRFLENKGSTAEFAEEEAKLEEQFAMISGVSPFSSQSLPPSGVVSGDAMEALKESDDSRISLTADNINSSAIAGWKIDIRLNRQFAKGPRLLRYVGENNDVELIDWYASDLTSDDIVIDNEDELSQTPAQRRQMVKELLQYKLFSTDVDPKVRSKVLEMLKLGNWEDTDDIEELHINKAKRENKFILEGKLPVYKDYDIHSLHLQEHNRFRLDVKYEEFEASNPELAAAFDEHCKMHEQVDSQKAAALAEQMNPKKGPAESIPFKDLPPSGRIQMAQQAGIQLTPEDVAQQIQIDAKVKQDAKVKTEQKAS